MKVRLQQKDLFSTPVIVGDLQSIVLLDDNDQPLFVASMADRGIWTVDVSDPKFNQLVKSLGVVTREAEVISLDELVQQPK